jgi:hypothetical protein
MDGHLDDLPALEWARNRKMVFADTTTERVAAHLETCAECRVKVAAFEDLERQMSLYERPVDRRPRTRILRWLAVAAGVALMGGAISIWLLLAR